MCGIFATTNPVDENVLKAFEKGKSRGPESTQSKIVKSASVNLFLGFHRLAINGLDDISNQPMCIDGIYLICNGEIYNYRKLGVDYELETKSDCEVIIHIYKRYGMDYLLDLLDGVFSFVLVDTNQDKIFIARDPYGVRPLFYNEDFTVFASERKQVCPFGKTFQFPPGNYAELKSGENANMLYFKKYTSFGFSKMIFNNLFDIYGIIYQSLLTAVRKRVTTTERPIACLLSGGLDSSIITAMVNSLLPQGTLETYSIGLEGSTDLVYAQKVADHLGTKHTSIVLTEDEFFDAIPETIYAIESFDTTTVRASVGNYLIGKYISTHSDAKVIFNGDGSDELTGGYLYFNKCTNFMDFDHECKRLLDNIHYFDVLRSDRCISCHGLEPRTPFLDRTFVQNYLSILPEIRCHSFNNQPEKFLLRASIDFINPKLLPPEVLNRTKEAFSDGVSSTERSWYKIIQEKLNDSAIIKFDYLNPTTAEQSYYREIFENNFKNQKAIPYFWMPKWSTTLDPSARTL